MSVPSKWVLGDKCYFPRNKFMELKLSMTNADPKEDWKEITIENELLRHHTKEQCDAIKSGTEYETDESESPDSPVIAKRRKRAPSFDEEKENVAPKRTPDQKRSREATLVRNSDDRESRSLLNESLTGVSRIEGACAESLYSSPQNKSLTGVSRIEGACAESLYSSPQNKSFQGSQSFKKPEKKAPSYGDTSNKIKHTSNYDSPAPTSISPARMAPDEYDMTISRRLSDRLESLENIVEDVRSRQGKLMKMLVKVHEILKFRDSSASNEDEIPQIESQDDFDSVEDALLDPATKNKLIENIKRFGGSTYTEMINIALKRLMTVDFRCGVNLCGRGGKMAFASTQLFKAIEQAVKQAFSDSTESNIREAIGRHIKGAPDRKGGSGRANKKDKN